MSTDNDSLRADYAALVQRLAQVEQQNLTLMRGNADAMLIVDGDGTIRYANPAVEPLLDHDAAGLVGLPFGHPLAGKGPATIEIGQKGRSVGKSMSAGMCAPRFQSSRCSKQRRWHVPARTTGGIARRQRRTAPPPNSRFLGHQCASGQHLLEP